MPHTGDSSAEQAARDAAYDNVAAVPGSREWMAQLRADSAHFRAHPQSGWHDVQWGPEPANRWTLYPSHRAHAPCLIFIHGGYWKWNRPEDFACLAEGLIAHGWSVAMPAHTLAPAASLTRIVHELEQALDWLAEQGDSHGISGPYVLSGWSAGGTLATLLLGHSLITSGLCLSGIHDLAPLRETYLNAALNLSAQEIEEFSPLHLSPCPKPLCLAFGTQELPVFGRDAAALHGLRNRHQCPTTLMPVPQMDHFRILDMLRAPDGLLTRWLVETT